MPIVITLSVFGSFKNSVRTAELFFNSSSSIYIPSYFVHLIDNIFFVILSDLNEIQSFQSVNLSLFEKKNKKKIKFNNLLEIRTHYHKIIS